MTPKHTIFPRIFENLENCEATTPVQIILDWLTKGEQKVLRKIIFEDKRGRFGNITIAEIMRDTNLGSKHTVINALRKLERMKIVSKVGFKNSYTYHVNPDLTMVIVHVTSTAKLYKTEEEAMKDLPSFLEAHDIDKFFRVDGNRLLEVLNAPKRCSEDTKTVQSMHQNGAISCTESVGINLYVNLIKSYIELNRHGSDGKIKIELPASGNVTIKIAEIEEMEIPQSMAIGEHDNLTQGNDELVPAEVLSESVNRASNRLYEHNSPEPPSKQQNPNPSTPERRRIDPRFLSDYLPVGNEWVDEDGYIHDDDEEIVVAPKKEASYVDVESEEDDGSGVGVNRRPKWSLPDNSFEQKILQTCHRKYFRKGEKSRVKAIEKAMISIRINPGNPPRYPTEFVEDMIKWALGMNKGHYARIELPALLSAIESEDNRTRWLSKFRRKELGK